MSGIRPADGDNGSASEVIVVRERARHNEVANQCNDANSWSEWDRSPPGGAAAMGSNAFAVELVDRDANGTIESDLNAYLQLQPNGEYSEISNSGDNELNVTLQRLNSDSITELEDIFFIRNGGQDTVDVAITGVGGFDTDVTVNDIFVSSKSAGGASVGASLVNNREPLPVGERIGVGVEVEIDGKLPAGADTSGTFHVDADNP
ncbi:hypothetical protein [Halorubrum depositum]|uniref:hypothetical protein n=1 Tax=Halorubrum depositum TaxID=2583992 RepID=UPI0011A3EECF|nr:hypothetical protein [Halorubrum depositum]